MPTTRPKSPYRCLLFTLAMLCFSRALPAQIINIEEQRITGTNDSTRWYGQLRVGATLMKVQDQLLQLNTAAQVEFKQKRSLLLFLLDTKFLRAGGQDFNNAGFAHLRYNHRLTDPLSLEFFAQAQYNRLLFIERRSLAGMGLRYRLLKSADGQNRVYGGLAYLFEHNRFTDATDDRQWHRLSSYLSFTFRPWEGVKLVSTTYFQPQLKDWANHRFATEWRLDMPLGKKLSFSTDFTYGIDKALPAGAPLSTYTWINGLVFKF